MAPITWCLSSPTRDRTWAPCIGSTVFETTGPLGRFLCPIPASPIPERRRLQKRHWGLLEGLPGGHCEPAAGKGPRGPWGPRGSRAGELRRLSWLGSPQVPFVSFCSWKPLSVPLYGGVRGGLGWGRHQGKSAPSGLTPPHLGWGVVR